MLSSNAVYVKILRHLAQAACQVFYFPLDLFTVVKITKVVFELPKKVCLFVREYFTAKDFQEVAKISSPMESYPVIALVHNEATGDQVLCHKPVWYPICFVPVQRQPGLVLQHNH